MKNNNVFPIVKKKRILSDDEIVDNGLSKLELFSAIIMSGLLSNLSTTKWSAEHSASESVRHARELIKELEK